jgi:hypothetical protein
VDSRNTMSETVEIRLRNCKNALHEKMDALRQYSNVLLKEIGKFDENELFTYVDNLEKAIRDYENVIDEPR